MIYLKLPKAQDIAVQIAILNILQCLETEVNIQYSPGYMERHLLKICFILIKFHKYHMQIYLTMYCILLNELFVSLFL